ncbi:MAG: ABC transporter substrate-binding protein [Candidatus Bipolaricaulota bacterium]
MHSKRSRTLRELTPHTKLAMLLSAVLALMAGSACTGPVTVDQTGAEVELRESPGRVLSAYGPATYFVYALGEGDRIVAARYVALTDPGGEVGALHQHMDPEFATKLMPTRPETEEILVHEPDLVLTNPNRNRGMADILRDLGVPAAEYVPESVEGVLDAVELTGELLGPEVKPRAEALVTELEHHLAELDRAVGELSAEERPRVLFVGTTPFHVASGDMLQTELIARAGGRSVSAELGGGWREISLEQLTTWDPEVIVIAPYGNVGPTDLLDDPHWAWIDAVRSGRVYKMPRIAAPWDAPVPDAVLGALWLAQVFHTDMAPLGVADEARVLYEEYYGISLPGEVLERLTVP